MNVRPGIVQAGAAVDLLVELPRLRPGPGPVRLEIDAEGLRVLSTRLVDEVDAETLWAARVRVDTAPGTLLVVLRAAYADGRSVEVDVSLVVLGEEEEPGRAWWKVALAAVVAVGFGVAALLVARHRA